MRPNAPMDRGQGGDVSFTALAFTVKAGGHVRRSAGARHVKIRNIVALAGMQQVNNAMHSGVALAFMTQKTRLEMAQYWNVRSVPLQSAGHARNFAISAMSSCAKSAQNHRQDSEE